MDEINERVSVLKIAKTEIDLAEFCGCGRRRKLEKLSSMALVIRFKLKHRDYIFDINDDVV